MAFKAPEGPPPSYPQPTYDAGPADPRAAQGYYGSPPPGQYGSPAPYQQYPQQQFESQGPGYHVQPGQYGYGPGPGPYQQQPMYYQQQPPAGYYDRGYGGGGPGAGGGICAGILAAMACCCCFDLLLF